MATVELSERERFIYSYVAIDGRRYRYSDQRRLSGRPASIQFLNARGEWRDVRNVDRSDQLWELADVTERTLERLSA